MSATSQSLLQEAREFLLVGNFDKAEERKKQAEGLKAINALDTPAAPPAMRPSFGGSTGDSSELPTTQEAVKSLILAPYVKKYGEPIKAVEQIYKELYRTDEYYALLSAKYADMENYCRSGMLTGVSRMLVFTPDQLIRAIKAGVGVEGNNIGSIKSTMVEAQDQLGGFLVLPEDARMDIINRLPGMTVVRGLARKITTMKDKVTFPIRRGGNKRYIGNIRSTQTDESPSSLSTSETNALWGQVEIPVHVNLANVPVSKSLLEDSGPDMLNEVLMPEFTSQGAIKEDEQFLTGSGVKEPQGILNGIAAGSSAGVGGATPLNTDISRQATGSAAALSFDAFVKAPYLLAGQYRQRTNPSTAYVFTSASAGLTAALKNADGEYLWREMWGNNAVGAPDTLRGWQVKESEAMPEVAAFSYPVIFGDFQGYRIVDRVGMSVQRYDDASTAATDSVVFYLRRRYGGQVAEGWRFVVIQCSTT